MDHPKYSASLSQTQGRSGYSVIFRHPTRRHDATGKPGIRVRRGLGTRDEAEARRLLDELNVLLGDAKYHDPAARPEAERRFDRRVVDIFFNKMVPEEPDFSALREAVIGLPKSSPDGYRRVLFLGTTGAGKTTLVRQLIGTDPVKERFPSTSTAKTTIHDTEIVLAEGDWRAVVTFAPREEVREYVNECISDAVLAAARGAKDAEVLRRLLNHANQRFRFSYVLGNGPKVTSGSSDFDDEDEESEGEEDLLSEGEATLLMWRVPRSCSRRPWKRYTVSSAALATGYAQTSKLVGTKTSAWRRSSSKRSWTTCCGTTKSSIR